MKTKLNNTAKILVALMCTILFVNCEKKYNDTDYQISINELLDIELESNRSTGYSWYWLNKDEAVVVDTLKREYVETTNGKGQKGIEVWSFIGKKQGVSTITLVYKRSNNDSDCKDKKHFLIEVK